MEWFPLGLRSTAWHAAPSYAKGYIAPTCGGQRVDRAGNLLESLNPPTGNKDGSFSTYVEFSRAAGEIVRVKAVPFSHGLLGVDSIAWRTASVTSPPAVIPLPAAGWALFPALFGLRRRISA